jgi:hypothetical protein
MISEIIDPAYLRDLIKAIKENTEAVSMLSNALQVMSRAGFDDASRFRVRSEYLDDGYVRMYDASRTVDILEILKEFSWVLFNLSEASVHLSSIKSRLKETLFNQSVTANTNIFASYLTPASPPCTFRIFTCFNTAGVLSVVKRVGATEVVMQLNSGISLSANCLYAFDIAVASGEEINFRYSVNATALDVKVLEIPASIS